jgi:hypothetical protein
MSYLFEQAWRQITRQMWKNLLVVIQLLVALVILQIVISVYLSEKEEYSRYINIFGSDIYKVEMFGQSAEGNAHQFSEEVIRNLKQKEGNIFTLLKGTSQAIYLPEFDEPILYIELSPELYRNIVKEQKVEATAPYLVSKDLKAKINGTINIDGIQVKSDALAITDELLQILGYRNIPKMWIIVPKEINKQSSEPNMKLWIKSSELSAQSMSSIHNILKSDNSNAHYSITKVVELPEAKMNFMRAMVVSFLFFTVSVLFIFCIGMLGANYIKFLSERHNWAIHIVYGAMKKQLMYVQVIYFLIIVAIPFIFSFFISDFVLNSFLYTQNDVRLRFGYTSLVSVITLLIIGVCSLIPFHNLRNMHITEFLK